MTDSPTSRPNEEFHNQYKAHLDELYALIAEAHERDHDSVSRFLLWHLLVEHHLKKIIEAMVPQVDWDKHSMMRSFTSKLDLIDRIQTTHIPKSAITGLKVMNEIRNGLAHNLKKTGFDTDKMTVIRKALSEIGPAAEPTKSDLYVLQNFCLRISALICMSITSLKISSLSNTTVSREDFMFQFLTTARDS